MKVKIKVYNIVKDILKEKRETKIDQLKAKIITKFQ